MVFVNLLFWGPLPVAWLWVGSQVDYATDSSFLGISSPSSGLLRHAAARPGHLTAHRPTPGSSCGARAGHDQREGIIGRVFGVAASIGAAIFTIWFIAHQRARARRVGPAPVASDGPARLLPAVRGHDRTRRSARSCASRPTSAAARRWPRSTRSTSRRRPGTSCPTPTSSPRSPTRRAAALQPLRDPHATELRRELGAPPRRGARARRRRQRRRPAAARRPPGRCWRPGDELVTPWPSYPLYPLMARAAGARAVPVPGIGRRRVLARRQRAHARRSRSAIPTTRPARYLPADALRALLERLPEHVDAPARRGAASTSWTPSRPAASLALLDDHPAPARLPHVLEGLRPGRPALRLRDGRPGLRAAARAARAGARRRRRSPSSARSRRCAMRAAGRAPPRRVLRRAPPPARGAARDGRRRRPSQANVLWLRAPGLTGGELAAPPAALAA